MNNDVKVAIPEDVIRDAIADHADRLRKLLKASDMEVLREAKRHDQMFNGGRDVEYYAAKKFVHTSREIRSEKIGKMIELLDGANPQVFILFPEAMDTLNMAIGSLPKI